MSDVSRLMLCTFRHGSSVTVKVQASGVARVIDRYGAQPWPATVTPHLAQSTPPINRFHTMTRIARCFYRRMHQHFWLKKIPGPVISYFSSSRNVCDFEVRRKNASRAGVEHPCCKRASFLEHGNVNALHEKLISILPCLKNGYACNNNNGPIGVQEVKLSQQLSRWFMHEIFSTCKCMCSK